MAATIELPTNLKRKLTTGESVYWSTKSVYCTQGREGKWCAQIRRLDAKGFTEKIPVRGFDSPAEAVKYVLSQRKGNGTPSASSSSDSMSMSEAHELWQKHGWKSVGERTKEGRLTRWRLHGEPKWGLWSMHEVKSRAVQEWVDELQATGGDTGCGNATLIELKNDLFQMWNVVARLTDDDRKNPFSGIDMGKSETRHVVIFESKDWSDILWTADKLAEPYGEKGHRWAEPWLVAAFKISLLAGLRAGEILALQWDRIDLKGKKIKVDRAMRRKAQVIDERTGKPVGPILAVAVNLPKGDKVREVPVSDQLGKILAELAQCRREVQQGMRPFVFPSETGTMREYRRFCGAFQNLARQLDALAKGKPQRFQRLNEIQAEIRALKVQLPDCFDLVEYRDTRASFSSYMSECRLPDGERNVYMGHGAKGVGQRHYERVTDEAFKKAQKALSDGWTWRDPSAVVARRTR